MSRLEQGNRGTGENSCASADAEREPEPRYEVEQTKRRDRDRDAEFDAWYAEYPRKRGKGQAIKAYWIARKKADPEQLLAAVRSQAPMLMAKGAELCPYPATWLNGERWADQPDNVRPLHVVDRQPLPGEVADDGTLLPPLSKGFFDQ